MKNYLSSLLSSGATLLMCATLTGLLLMSGKSLAEPYGDDKPRHCNKQGMHQKRGHDLSHMLGKLERKLELSAEQKTAIEQVINQYNPELTALQEQVKTAREAERELIKQESFNEAAVTQQAEAHAALMVKIQVLRAKAKHAIHAQLTEEQRVEIEKMFERHQQKKGKAKEKV